MHQPPLHPSRTQPPDDTRLSRSAGDRNESQSGRPPEHSGDGSTQLTIHAEQRPANPDDDVIIEPETRTKRRLKKPRMFRVLLHNDDYTTREFVVEVLCNVFHHDEQSAVRIMLHVHHNGVGIAGVYTYEVAEMKARTVETLARQREFPLMLTLEPEDDEDS